MNDFSQIIDNKIVDSVELEETIINLFREQYDNYFIANFVDLIMNYVSVIELIDDNDIKKILDEDDELKEINYNIQGLVNSLSNMVKPDFSNEDSINKLLQYRDKLEERVKLITCYNDLVEMYELILNRYSCKYSEKDLIADDKEFSGELLQFTFSNEQNIIINEKIKGILGILPVRMTKQKTFDYIIKSFSIYYGAYVNDLDNFINMLKDTFKPENNKLYGLYYKKISDVFDYYSTIDYNKLNEQEIKEAIGQLSGITIELEDILNICNILVEVINKLISLLLNNDVDFNRLVNKEPSVVNVIKIINIIKNNYGREDFEDILYKRLQTLEGVQENWLDNIRDLSYYVDLTYENHKDFITDKELYSHYENLIKIRNINKGSLYVDINNMNNDYEQAEQVDKKSLYERVDKFVEYVDNEMSNLPRDIKRAKLNQILTLLPPAFEKPQQFYDYIYNTLQLCNNDYDKRFIKHEIAKLKVEYI